MRYGGGDVVWHDRRYARYRMEHEFTMTLCVDNVALVCAQVSPVTPGGSGA